MFIKTLRGNKIRIFGLHFDITLNRLCKWEDIYMKSSNIEFKYVTLLSDMYGVEEDVIYYLRNNDYMELDDGENIAQHIHCLIKDQEPSYIKSIEQNGHYLNM